jgi:hypothetical protein
LEERNMQRKPFFPALFELISSYMPHFKASQRAWLSRLLPTPGNVIFTLAVALVLLWASSAGAFPWQVPAAPGSSTSTVAYQGRLANSSGAPLTGTYPMEFRLYSQPYGGTNIWSEPWTGENSVQVSDGLFNVMLGSVKPIPQNVITGNNSLWLGITVGADSEMQPRVQLGSVPFAVQALTVPDGSITTAKIADEAVTRAKLAPGSLSIPVYSTGTAGLYWAVPDCLDHFYTVPGLSLTVTTDMPSVLDITFSGLGVNTRAASAIYTKIYVDNMAAGSSTADVLVTGCRNPGGSTAAPYCSFSNTFTKEVAAGSHLVEVRALCDGGSAATGQVVSGWLTARVFSQ